MPRIVNGIGWTLENIYTTSVILQRHNHNRDRWLGEHGVRNLEIDCGATGTVAPFQNTAGNDTWSVTPLCLIGTGDGPFVTGMTRFDVHRIHIMDVAVGADLKLHYVRFVYGTGTVADAITAEQFTEICFSPERAAVSTVIELRMPRLTYGTDKVWVTHWVDGDNVPTIDFRLGVHEYED